MHLRSLRGLCLLCAFVFFGVATPSQAIPVTIASFGFGGGIGVGGPGPHPFDTIYQAVSLGVGGTPPVLFDDVAWTTADVGTTVWFDSNVDDPGYDSFVSNVTNGLIDDFRQRVSFLLGGGVFSPAVSEPTYFGTLPGGNGTDLGGFIITRVGLRLDSLSFNLFDPPGPDETGTQAFFSSSVLFEADVTAVPEPASLVLLGVGTIGVATLVRRRRA